MKDPLQKEPTPYELLGVEPGESRAEINRAYINAIRKGVSTIDARNALDVLNKPAKRARFDQLQYNSKTVGNLHPNPLQEISSLDPIERAATATAWENQLKKKLPDNEIAHNLAVLWYWWAMHEEERYEALLAAVMDAGISISGKPDKADLLRQIGGKSGITCDLSNKSECAHIDCEWRKECMSSAPPLKQMWQKVIGYWSMLANSPEFWTNTFDLPDPEIKYLRYGIIDELRNKLVELVKKYSYIDNCRELTNIQGIGEKTSALLHDAGIYSFRDMIQAGVHKLSSISGISLKKAEQLIKYAQNTLSENDDGLSEQYRSLELELAVELKTAKALGKAGVRTQHGVLYCGALMLNSLEMLNSIRTSIDNLLEKNPGDARLLSLKDAVSEFALITAQIESNKPEAALRTISRLPTYKRNLEEVVDLKARALYLRGQKQASLGRFKAALESWDKARNNARRQDLKKKIETTVVKMCHTRAVELNFKRHDRDGAIDILEVGLVLVEDEKLELTLAEFLCHRGIERFKKGQELIEGKLKNGDDVSDADLSKLEQGTVDLERASQHGSKRAEEQVIIARIVYAQMITGRGLKLFNEGQKEIEKASGVTNTIIKKLEKGVKDLERAAELGSQNAKEQLKAAREMLDRIKSGDIDISGEVNAYYQNIKEAIDTKDWDRAVEYFREALKNLGSKAPKDMKKNMAVCLFNRGVQRANEVVEEMKKGKTAQLELLLSLVESVGWGAVLDERCARCRKNYPTHSFSAPDGRKVPLCAVCAVSFQKIMQGPPKPNAKGLESLKAAYIDLVEAARLDQSNGNYKKNADQVKKMLQDMDESVPSIPGQKSAQQGLSISVGYLDELKAPAHRKERKSERRLRPAGSGRNAESGKYVSSQRWMYGKAIKTVLAVVTVVLLIEFLPRLWSANMVGKFTAVAVPAIMLFGNIILLSKRR